MTLEELRAQHPNLFSAAVAEGHAQGVQTERDRVSAHLQYGQGGGAEGMRIATEAISAGTVITETMRARYWNLALNSRDQNLRAADEQTVGDVANAPGNAPRGTPQSATGGTTPTAAGNGTPSAGGTTPPTLTEAEEMDQLGVTVAKRIKALNSTAPRTPVEN